MYLLYIRMFIIRLYSVFSGEEKKNSLIIHSSNNCKEKKIVTKTWHVKPVILLLMHICLRGQRFAYP